MRRSALLALAAVAMTLPCVSADTITLKDGSKVEWRSIVDQGDTYSVETDKGAKVTIKKADIEKISFSVAGGPLTGATYTKLAGKPKTLNCIPLIDPKRDLIGVASAELKMKGPILVCNFQSDTPMRVQVPVKVPSDEFDFSISVERKGGIGDFFVGLIGGGRQFLVRFDGIGSAKSGLDLVDGKPMESNGTGVIGPHVPKGKSVEITCAVRKDTLMVMVDRKEVVAMAADWKRFSLPEAYSLRDGKAFLFFGSQKVVGTSENLFHVTKVAMAYSE